MDENILFLILFIKLTNKNTKELTLILLIILALKI